ncbi:MAG: M10 family metallopeptidase C-terminal domain-containing protein [Caulobacteraceae bacterium]
MPFESDLQQFDTFAAGDALSASAASKPVLTIDQAAANLGRRDIAWPGVQVVYSFRDATPPGIGFNVAFQPLTAEMRTFVRAAFDIISDIIPMHFVERPDDSTLAFVGRRIEFAADSNLPDYEWGETKWFTQSSSPRDRITGAEIWLNPDGTALRKWFFGGYNFAATMHEIMHGLGLVHPADYNANGDPITYAKDAVYMQDSRQYTLMSYFDASETGADFIVDSENAIFSGATPLLHDIAALQLIYGANTATRTGDTVYGYNSTAGRPEYDFIVNKTPIFCIWDAGGNDTLDLSGSAAVCNLDLRQGAFSDAFTMTRNISIAYGAQVENTKGGSASDHLTGNALDNRLEGGPGDDVLDGGDGSDILDGGDGFDTAVYGGLKKDYVWWADNGKWLIQRADGGGDKDTLISVEQLQFSDTTVKLSGVNTRVAIEMAYQNVLRVPTTDWAANATVNTWVLQVEKGATTVPEVTKAIVALAQGTTSVASLAYEFFTGKVPTRAGFDYLIALDSPNTNNINSPYYQAFSLENRYINFAVNLGKLGEGKDAFAANYGTLSLFDATKQAYATIFGSTPTDAKVHAVIDTRVDYFAAYGLDGPAGIGTKAAMVGWLLSEAVKADVGAYAKANDAFLSDLADGALFAIDLIGVYGDTSYAYPG